MKLKYLVETDFDKIEDDEEIEMVHDDNMTPTAHAYIKYLRSLSKFKLLNIHNRLNPEHPQPKTALRLDLAYMVMLAQFGREWQGMEIDLPPYAKPFLTID